MSFIEMDHIRKSFGSLEVLKDVTLHVETGEVISIIGPSGSGKSTFLRCLCQLETINSGSIVVDGQTMVSTPEGSSRAVYAPAADVRTICRRMGMCFQHFNLFPHMTVLDNILEAPRIVKKMKTEEIMPKAEELLKKSASGINAMPIRRASPAASSSVWPSPAPWPWTRTSCSSTNRRAPWTRN